MTRKGQVSTLLEVVPLQQLLKIRMEDFVTLNGATPSANCVNTECSSATASCHKGTLLTPSSDSGFRISALDMGRKRKKRKLLWQLSAFEHSMVLVSTGGQPKLVLHPFGAYDFNNCATSRPNSVTTSCQSSILPTPSSGRGFRSSAATTGCIRKKSQLL